MTIRTLFAATAAALVLITASGCAVTRGQETTGAYIDDTAITTAVKARFVDDLKVDAAAISVETLNGTVMLSGCAKNIDREDQRREPDVEGQGREVGRERDRRPGLKRHN